MLNWITCLSSEVLHLSAHESLKRLNRLFKSTGTGVLFVILRVLCVEIDHSGVTWNTRNKCSTEINERGKKSIIIGSTTWAVFISALKDPWNLFDLIKSRSAQSALKEKERSCWSMPKPIICAGEEETRLVFTHDVAAERSRWILECIDLYSLPTFNGFATQQAIRSAANQRRCLESTGFEPPHLTFSVTLWCRSWKQLWNCFPWNCLHTKFLS